MSTNILHNFFIQVQTGFVNTTTGYGNKVRSISLSEKSSAGALFVGDVLEAYLVRRPTALRKTARLDLRKVVVSQKSTWMADDMKLKLV